MKTHQAAATIAVSLTLALSSQARSQGNDAGVAQHVEAARKAAGKDFEGVFTRICGEARAPSTPPPAAPAAVRAAGAPDRSTWYAEPVKVFVWHEDRPVSGRLGSARAQQRRQAAARHRGHRWHEAHTG